jgi:hypothetical protein
LSKWKGRGLGECPSDGMVCPLTGKDMINQYEVAACLQDELPEVSVAGLDIVANINSLTEYVRRKASLVDLGEVRKCMLFAERLYSKGNRYVRDVIENVFVYSFSTLLMGERRRKMQLQALIPLSLYSIYIRQING